VRFPIVVGPCDPKKRLAVYLRLIKSGAPIILPDGGKYKRRFIYKNAAASAIAKIFAERSRTLGKVFQFGGEIMTLKKFVNLCFKYCGVKPNILNKPAAELKKQGYNFSKENPYFNSFDYVLRIDRARRIGWRHPPAVKWLKKAIKETDLK
jgi:nucleoside-diphosphate-sugar epimerase